MNRRQSTEAVLCHFLQKRLKMKQVHLEQVEAFG